MTLGFDTRRLDGTAKRSGQPSEFTLAQAQPAGRSGQAGYSTYEAGLFGGTVSAVPGERDTRGGTNWTVNWSGPEGFFSTEARLSGQFGAAQLTDGSYGKNQLGAQILGVRARAIPPSVSESSFRNLGMDAASAPLANEMYSSMRAQGHGIAQSWGRTWQAYLGGYASGGPEAGRRSLSNTVVNAPSVNLAGVRPAEAQTAALGEPFDVQPFGDRARVYQVRNGEGNYELRLRLNEPEQYRQSDFLVFENAGRPIDMRRDYSQRLADGIGPIPNPFRTVGSPVFDKLNGTLKQALDADNRAPQGAQWGMPMSDNPLERFWRGAGGAVRAVTGDTAEFLARIAPYMGSGAGVMPVTQQALEGQRLNQQVAAKTSEQFGNAILDVNDALGFAMGVPPDSPEVTAGRIMMGVAEGIEGIFGLARGALALGRSGDDISLFVRNTDILNRFRNPSADELKRVVSFVDRITPNEYATMPTSVKLAVREGLSARKSAAGVQGALARLDNLDGLSSAVKAPMAAIGPSVASQSGGALANTAIPNAAAFNANLGTRFGKTIEQSVESGRYVARLGDDPRPLLTSQRPMTGEDFRQGPGKQALDARNPVAGGDASPRNAGNGGSSAIVPGLQAGFGGVPIEAFERGVSPVAPRPSEAAAPLDGAGGSGAIVPGSQTGLGGVPIEAFEGSKTELSELASSGVQANPEVLARIRSASATEINEWLGPMSDAEKLALPEPVHKAILANFARQLESLPVRAAPEAGEAAASALANAPELQRLGKEILFDLGIDLAVNTTGEQLKGVGPFMVFLSDSGSGSFVAYPPIRQVLDKAGVDAAVVVTGDHKSGAYGARENDEIVRLVFNWGGLASSISAADAESLSSVLAMACNTACIADFYRQDVGTDFPSDGIPVLNLIDNTAKDVADPANRAIYGSDPVILSTGATRASGHYPRLISEYSNGEVTAHNIGGSDKPIRRPDGSMQLLDLATLVNQQAPFDPAREAELAFVVKHYVDQFPPNMTSLVMCCTHYPALSKQFRRELDSRGMAHVPIINPMPVQGVRILEALAASAEGAMPSVGERRVRPDVVVTSADGVDNPGAEPGSGAQTLREGRGIATFAGKDLPTFFGREFGSADFPGNRIADFINGYTGPFIETDADFFDLRRNDPPEPPQQDNAPNAER